MSPTVTKTLQAAFAPPTAHKQSKLNDLLETYRDGLQEAFDAGASTMSAVSENQGRRNLRMPNDNELFAVVTEHNGGNHVRIRCEDGKNRMGRIPGRMKYRTWINEGDVVLVEPWDWQDEKANIEWRYTGEDADQLRREGHIQ